MTYPHTQLFIDGQWRDAADGRSLAVFNPATGREIGRVAHAGIPDLDLALVAAQKGFKTWCGTPAVERGKIMRRAAGLMRERASAIADVMTQEQGKPLAEARIEAMSAADTIEWFADEGMRVYGRIVPARNGAVRQMVLKDPVGPVAAFTPWNFPINQAVRKMSAALATGSSIIVKAPEETPASAAALVQAFVDAGVPAGVVGLVYGNPAEISGYLIAHPVIRKITFTGSTPVGKQLAALAGRHMKRVTMELGGHATVAESGFPGFEAYAWQGLVVPAATPDPIVARLNTALNHALTTKAVVDRLEGLGIEPTPSTPADLAQFTRREEATWQPIVRSLGVTLD